MAETPCGELFRERIGEAEPIFYNGQTKISEYSTRLDPLTNYIAKISKERANGVRGSNIGVEVSLDMKPDEHCRFCYWKRETPENRIYHKNGSVSVRNLYSWEGEQWVTIYPPFEPHRLLLSEFEFGDLESLMETERELADRYYSMHKANGHILGMSDFTNWGPFAGASQQHPHSQRSTISYFPDPEQRDEMEQCRRLSKHFGANIFDVMIEVESELDKRSIYSGDVYIGATFAPRFNDEVIIIPKESVTHILQTDETYRKKIIDPTLGMFRALFFYRGITNLNIAVHMAPFAEMDSSRGYYRWHMHIYPRKSKLPSEIAGAEIGYGHHVIGVYPEYTAEVLGSWFREGPREDMVLPNLREMFRGRLW